jgi:hypothetical protein
MDKKLAQFASKVKRNGDEFFLSVPQKELEKIGAAEGDDVVIEIRKYLTHIEFRGRK